MHVCRRVWGTANGSHAHPFLWEVTQADVMPGICKLGLLPPWGLRRYPSSPAPTLTLGPTPWDLSWKEGIFERLSPMTWGQPSHSSENSASWCLQPLQEYGTG